MDAEAFKESLQPLHLTRPADRPLLLELYTRVLHRTFTYAHSLPPTRSHSVAAAAFLLEMWF